MVRRFWLQSRFGALVSPYRKIFKKSHGLEHKRFDYLFIYLLGLAVFLGDLCYFSTDCRRSLDRPVNWLKSYELESSLGSQCN